MRKKFGFLISSLGLCLLVNPAYANLPLPPRLSVLAYASDYTVGQADLMLPLQANTSQNLYVDPALSYGSNNQNEMDIGLGYRWIVNQAAILGGYFFGGYSRIENNARLWVANPGIEALGSRWDAHLNAYFPLGDRHTAGSGIENFFSGHSQFRSVFLVHQYVGNGGDAKVGYQLFPALPLKAYLGSYYFLPAETNNIWGGAAGLEYWLTQGVKLVGSYTYDNLHHSTYAFGIGLEWGGTRVHRADQTLEERLTDPVERYLAQLGRGSTIPSTTKNQLTGGGITTTLIRSNIAFFSQTGGPNNAGIGLTLASCTFENPCGPTDFTQTSVTTLGGLLPNTQFYFNGGNYITNGIVNLSPGQSLQSRTADYSQPVNDSDRSVLFANQIGLQGNNSLQNIILLRLSSTVTGSIGVNITAGSSNNSITGSEIGSFLIPFDIGVQDTLGNNTLIDNSVINGFSAGVRGSSSVNMTIQNSEINSEMTLSDTNDGVYFTAGSSASISNTSINVGNTAASFVITANGVRADAGSIVNVTNSSIFVNAFDASVNGLQGQGPGTAITMTGGQIVLANSPSSTAQIKVSGGSSIVTIQGGTVCQVNGTTVVCP